MRVSTLALQGTPENIVPVILAAKLGSRVIRVTVADDDQVKVQALPEAPATGTDEYEYQLDGNQPTTSIAIALPTDGNYSFLAVETTDLPQEAAALIMRVVAGSYEQGYVAGTNHAEAYMPTPSTAVDRIVLRAPNGKKIADITLEDAADETSRITAALAYSDANQANPVIALAAIGTDKVYGINPQQLDQIADGQLALATQIELPGNVVRASRSDNLGQATFLLDDGRQVKVRSDEDGQLQVAGIIDVAADDTVGAWQGIGATTIGAIPTRGYVQPGPSGVSYRFEQATPTSV